MTLLLRALAVGVLIALGCGERSGTVSAATNGASGGAGGSFGMGGSGPRGEGGGGGVVVGGVGGAAGDSSGGASVTGAGGGSGNAGTGSAVGGGASGASSDALTIVYPAEFVGPDIPLAPLASGSEVHLVVPPQGGHVLFIGARFKNVRGDTVRLHTRLKDPEDGAVATEESRSVSVLPVPGDSSLSETDNSSLTQVSNITACPDYGPRAMVGLPYILELTVTELMVPSPREATVTMLVTPACPQGGDPDAAFCACECAGSYTLGKCPHP